MHKNRDLKSLAILLFKLTKRFVTELFEPKLSFYAASMSWSTLFFLIPLLVIVLSVTVHTPIFSEYYDRMHALITQSLLPATSKQLISLIDKFVANASQMGYIGAVYVTVAAVLFFRDFDYIVNDIFDQPRRPFFAALMVYGTLLIFVPVAIGASMWLFALLDNKIHIAPLILQFLLIWAVIMTVFKITPQESIPFDTLALSSFITTFVWFIAKNIFLFYIFYNKTYSTIYGTVSIVLFTFLWIYISWTIFIHGLQLCNMLLKDEEDMV